MALLPDDSKEGNEASQTGFGKPEKINIVDRLEEAGGDGSNFSKLGHDGSEVVEANTENGVGDKHVETDLDKLEAAGDTSWIGGGGADKTQSKKDG